MSRRVIPTTIEAEVKYEPMYRDVVSIDVYGPQPPRRKRWWVRAWQWLIRRYQ